jgi:PAS domain S-box-containing protein
MPLGCLVIDLAGEIVDVNPKALEILGSPSAEITKQINMLSFQPLVDQGVADIARRSLGGEPKIIDDILYTSTWGKTTAIRFTATPIYDEQGCVCLSMVMMEDLTDYNTLKSELERTNKLLKTVIDSVPSLIWMKDVDGKYLHCNKPYEDFCSFAGSIIGKTDQEIWGDDTQQYIDADRQAMECEYPITITEQVPHPILGNRWYHTTKVGFCDDSKNVIGSVGISCDITRKHEQDQILAEAIETLTASLNGNTYVK